MAVTQDIALLSSLLRHEGMIAAASVAAHRLSARLGFPKLLQNYDPSKRFDQMHGVDTCDIVGVQELGLVDSVGVHAVEYNPTQAHEFLTALGRLDIDHRQYQFLDYGSGKGKVLLLAAKFPFMRITGIEAAECMHQTACANIAKYASAKPACTAITSICIDAAAFVPSRHPVVVYMYNPFDEIILRDVLDQLGKAASDNSLPSYLIYRNPVQHKAVVTHNLFQHVGSVFGDRIYIYRAG
ncbi:MAG: hypothetical protein JXQ99_00810 [Hyphomicrobiaceae bacterium]